MPGLVVFKRRWGLGSDDLVFPALVEIVIRVAWLVAMIIIYELHHQLLTLCDNGHLLKVYLLGVIVILLLVIALNFVIFLISMQGTIMNTEPRKRLPAILMIRAFIVFPEVIWNVVGTYWSFSAPINCPNDVVTTIRITVVCGWALVWSLMFAIAILFDPLGNEIYNQGSYVSLTPATGARREIFESKTHLDWSHKVWEWRMQVCCCCIQDDNSQEVYSVVAKLFSSFFQDADLVPSDIAAGLVLLHQQEKASLQHGQLTAAVISQVSNLSADTQFQNEEKPLAWQNWMTPELASHYMKFTVGCYGWPAYMYNNCKFGLCHLLKRLRCFRCSKNPMSSVIVDDNCCQCHTTALLQLTGLSEDDLVYVSFHNRIYEVPFYVAIDHQTCAVVVAIRGTMSIKDTLTDLTIDCEPLDARGGGELPSSLVAHKGMLRAARFVQQRLAETNAIEDAIALYPSFTLVVTGHSLGAGTAAILALLLKPSYPNIRCYTFSPPGALLNREAAQYSEEIVMSVVIGHDVVPRLSYATMDDLKRRLMRALYACHSPKYRILINECFDLCFGLGAQYEWSTASTPGQNNPLLNENSASGGHHNATYESLSEIVHTSPSTRVPYMYLPGLIMHLESYKAEGSADSSYTMSWREPEAFNRIAVMPQMLYDHDPFTVLDALQHLVNQQSTNYHQGQSAEPFIRQASHTSSNA